MKARYIIIIAIVCFLSGGGTWAVIDWKFMPCPVPDKTDLTPGPEHPPVITDNNNPYSCGKTIHIDGTMLDTFSLRVKAYNDCMSNYRDFTLSYTCPMPRWTLAIGIIGGAGYSPELKKFDALIGGELALYRHYKKFAVGGGLWYMQSLTSQYKAGGVKADFLVSFGKQ